jgi:hypothetical protein
VQSLKPQPPRSRQQLTSVEVLLGILILCFTMGTILTLLAENGLLPLIIKGFSAEAGASLAVALTGLWISRQTFIQSLNPYLIYRSYPVQKGEMLLDQKVWRIELMNTGSGMAVLQGITARVEKGSKVLTIRDLDDYLNQKNLQAGRDYQWQQVSQGTALPPEGSLILAEITWKKLAHFDTIILRLEYENVLSQRYQKIISLSPR